MNPIITLVDDHVIFGLTEQDRKDLRRIQLIDGAGDHDAILAHQMCIMQAISLLTTPEEERDDRLPNLSDRPICVSEAITTAMIRLNDREGITSRQRARLKTLVEEVMNTCPVKRSTKQLKTKVNTVERRDLTPAYKRAEKQRAEILGAYDAAEYDQYQLKYKVSFAEVVRRIRKAAAVR